MRRNPLPHQPIVEAGLSQGVLQSVSHTLSHQGPARRLTDLGPPAGAVPLDLGQEFSHSWQEGVRTVTALWRADVERRRFLIDSTFAIGAGTAGIARWLTFPGEEAPDSGGGQAGQDRQAGRSGQDVRRVGASDVAAIREVTRSFGEVDNKYGGGRARAAVVKYLDTGVGPLLSGSYGESTGKALAAAVAELTRLAGWMAYDLEHHGLAQRYLIQALRLARRAEDNGLGGEILAGLSHQALYLGQPKHALDLARAALVAARGAGVAALLAEAHALEAHAHALLADPVACAKSLHAAELAFDHRVRGEEPEWIAYFDEAYLAARFAQCFRDLGDGRHAVGHALRSLEMDGRFVRGRMFNLTLLASAYVLEGEVEQACGVAEEALEVALGLDSARSHSSFADLRQRLAPHERRPAVAALLADAEKFTKHAGGPENAGRARPNGRALP